LASRSCAALSSSSAYSATTPLLVSSELLAQQLDVGLARRQQGLADPRHHATTTTVASSRSRP
jgi:hypothetical protein